MEMYFASYTDAQGQPVQAANGAWGSTTLYYPVTMIHEVTYVDADGEPVYTTDGYAIYEYESSESGTVTWEAYYDEAHIPTDCIKGYSSVERSYDEDGRLISERYLDRYNNLTNNQQH